jgi:uncharacterized membrane protein
MKKIFVLLLLGSIFFPSIIHAAGPEGEITFKAKVLNVIREEKVNREDGSSVKQQNVRLVGLDGPWKDKEFVYEGIGPIDVFSNVLVGGGDKVLVSQTTDVAGQNIFFIIDYVRSGWIYVLAIIFFALLVIVGRSRGVKSLISLIASSFIIISVILPLILAGYNPLLVSLLGAFLILLAIIYITWGFKRQAHIAMAAISVSLILTSLISILFTFLTRLTGATEEASFLINLTQTPINFEGLLLAGIVVGTLGVLDDVVIAQISTVEELYKLNPLLKVRDVYKKGMKVGIDHISSMTNTLFLAYAGASLPLLLLFKLSPGASFTQIINNEIIATEIVRTLTGSIGILLAVPISTFIAAYYFKHSSK